MAKFSFTVEGMDELFDKMKQLEEKSLGIAAQGLYEGAGIVAGTVDSAIHGIRTAPFKYAEGGEKRLPSPEEKAAIEGCAHGVAKFRKKLGRVDTSVGFNHAGYVNVNFKHMSSKARTNYKAVHFKNHEGTAQTTIQFIKKHTGKNIGKGAQNQKPIGVIANSINSGTSFMQKQPFMRKAFSQSKNKAIKAIEEGIKARLEELNIE